MKKMIVNVEQGRSWLEEGAPPRVDFGPNGYDHLMDGMVDAFTNGGDIADIETALYRSSYMRRRAFCRELSYAIPCREAVKFIMRTPIIEVGAGTGYWSALIERAGGNVIATDVNGQSNNYGHDMGCFHDLEVFDAATAVQRYGDRDVLMVWPTYGDPWAAQAAKAMQVGRLLHYIGEGPGGCTADDTFHEMMERDFELVSEMGIPQWEGIHDYLTTYRKKA